MGMWSPGSPAKFVMTVKLFMESPHITGDPKVLYMHYIQSVYNVITGIYPTSMDECVSLAALQLQAKFGDHNPAVYVRSQPLQVRPAVAAAAAAAAPASMPVTARLSVLTAVVCCRHKAGYLAHQLKGLVPSTLIPRKTPSQWEAEILGRHSLLTPEARGQPLVRDNCPPIPVACFPFSSLPTPPLSPHSPSLSLRLLLCVPTRWVGHDGLHTHHLDCSLPALSLSPAIVHKRSEGPRVLRLLVFPGLGTC
jgi:hypothetical protein